MTEVVEASLFTGKGFRRICGLINNLEAKASVQVVLVEVNESALELFWDAPETFDAVAGADVMLPTFRIFACRYQVFIADFFVSEYVCF